MTDHMDRESLMDSTGMGLLPGLVLAMGIVVFAMAALLTGSMWAVAGLIVIVSVVTAVIVYVVVALANLDPPAAQRITDYLDPRLPTS